MGVCFQGFICRSSPAVGLDVCAHLEQHAEELAQRGRPFGPVLWSGGAAGTGSLGVHLCFQSSVITAFQLYHRPDQISIEMMIMNFRAHGFSSFNSRRAFRRALSERARPSSTRPTPGRPW
jgi:hypothetical protein